MRVRSAAPLAIAAVVAAGSLMPAQAASKPKPIKKTYKVTLSPLPTEDPISGTACSAESRTDGVNLDIEPIKVSGPGKLTAKVTGFYGDWDMAVWSTSGSALADGGGTVTPTSFSTPAGTVDETLVYKSKKAQTLHLRVCNFLGSPEATVTYTYTYL